MSNSLTFYFTIPLNELEKRVKKFQEDFDNLLNDSFSDDELNQLENQIDSIGAVFVQPILSELSFDDFYPDSTKEEEQKEFFERSQSSLLLENLPFLEMNPFQVTYLQNLLESFDEVLIDRGGVFELCFKDDYLKVLSQFKTIDTYLNLPKKRPEIKTSMPVEPIDFLVRDVYQELERLGDELEIAAVPERFHSLFKYMKKNKTDATAIYQNSGLNAKEFDDRMESFKFFLRGRLRR